MIEKMIVHCAKSNFSDILIYRICSMLNEGFEESSFTASATQDGIINCEGTFYDETLGYGIFNLDIECGEHEYYIDELNEEEDDDTRYYPFLS